MGEDLNTAVFLDKHSRAWGGLGADGRACSSLSRPPGDANWINSSFRGSCSLRGHRGNVGWGRKMEGLHLALIGLLPVCILDCCSINTALSAAKLKWYRQPQLSCCHCQSNNKLMAVQGVSGYSDLYSNKHKNTGGTVTRNWRWMHE